jgi:WD40 repeat protein
MALEFLPDGSLLSANRGGGVRRWNLKDGSSELLLAGEMAYLVVTPDGRTAVVSFMSKPGSGTGATILDLETNEVRPLEGFHGTVWGLALSHQGDLLAISTDNGDIWIGGLSGSEHHYLFGHQTTVYGIAFSPDGRLLAAAGARGNIRVWPMPDMTKTPFLALPHDELMAKLDSFTNLRVVRDENSPTGWKQEIGPFPGWETVPEW